MASALSFLRRFGATIRPIVLVGGLIAATLAYAPGVSAANGDPCASPTIVGTASSDNLKGTPGPDVIAGLEGNDLIDGGGGNDVICGGPGQDMLVGGPGADKLYGGNGNDNLVGGEGDDTLDGGPGNDRLEGGEGVDGCDGGTGFNQLITCGAMLPPGAGATISGEGGATVQVPPGAIPYSVTIEVAVVANSLINAPIGGLPLLKVLQVILKPETLSVSLPPPSAPLTLSAPTDLPAGSRAILAQQVPTDSLSAGAVVDQLVATDTAVASGGKLTTQATIFPGVFGGGTFAFVQDTGSGFATGVVTDSTGARPGAVVSNNTNTLVSITNGTGRYTLFINGGPFSVTAFDPFRGSSGSASGNIVTSGSTVTANVGLTALAAPPITRDGIRNGGFERGDLTSWALSGAGVARSELVCPGATVKPTEGKFMADINTGPGSVGATGSAIKQRFRVPAGVKTLSVDFNFVSEEFPEFVGSQFNDSFQATVKTPNGETTFAQVSVNQSGGFSLIGDCGFPGGDSTSGQTGWRTGSVDLSAFSGTGTTIEVDLLFSANDAGDDIYDTHVLVDNIRFSTVWLDAKVVTNSTATRAVIEAEVVEATERLSQAGVNVRLRDVRTITDPGSVTDLDIAWTTGPSCADGRVNGRLTAEETQIVGLSRSAVTNDLNAYYIRSLSGGARGFAIGPDDFCVDVNVLTNSGTILANGRTNQSLAHEMGHILISPATAGSVLEHAAPAGNFLTSTPNLGNMTRAQSAAINRAGAPLLNP